MVAQRAVTPVLILRCRMPALLQEFEAGLLLAAVECRDPCKRRLAMLLTQDLQRVLEGCRQQLQELLSNTSEQLFVVSKQYVFYCDCSLRALAPNNNNNNQSL
jgi:hypothetical protein